MASGFGLQGNQELWLLEFVAIDHSFQLGGARAHGKTKQVAPVLRRAGDVAKELDVKHAAGFVIANVTGIRLAARGGTGDTELRAMARPSPKGLR